MKFEYIIYKVVKVPQKFIYQKIKVLQKFIYNRHYGPSILHSLESRRACVY